MPEPCTALVIGHRGASGYRPEHTRAAFELAIAQGADAVEPDVVATRDGALLVRHENEIGSTTDIASRPAFASYETRKEVDGTRVAGFFAEDLDLADLADVRAVERMPAIRPDNVAYDGRFGLLRLADVLRIADDADRPVGVVVELKHATHSAAAGLPLEELLDAELARAGWSAVDPRLTIESFERGVLERLRTRHPDARLVALVEAEGAPADRVARDGSAAAPYADDLTDAGLARLARTVQGVSVPISVLAPDLRASGRDAAGRNSVADSAHAAGLDLWVWTLRPENRFLPAGLKRGLSKAGRGDWPTLYEAVLTSGVEGVFADHPDLAIEVRESLAMM